MLPIKKIYIDTRLKAPDSRSDSDFFIDLPTTLLIPEDCGFYMEVCIPHTWYTVEEGFNDSLCFGMGPYHAEATVPAGNYSVTGLGAAIATAMSNTVSSSGFVSGEGPAFTHTHLQQAARKFHHQPVQQFEQFHNLYRRTDKICGKYGGPRPIHQQPHQELHKQTQ